MSAVRLAVMAALAAVVIIPISGDASSHREAPFITKHPKVDGTDLYLFNSYEAGREGYVTVIANYLPLQAPPAGPNYYALDPDALYEIHFDQTGNAVEDLTFQFRFTNEFEGVTLDIGPDGEQLAVPVPLINIGEIGPGTGDVMNLNRRESYSVTVVRGGARGTGREAITNVADGEATFAKPVDNIGNKSIPDYPAYAAAHVYDVTIPGCESGRMFVGQRREGFAVNLGELFDLVNLDPVGTVGSKANVLENVNVTSIALELPIACVTGSSEAGIVGAWTTASMRQARILNPAPQGPHTNAQHVGPSVARGAWTQVSRLGMPLVNEVVIGLPDKDRFNSSHPSDDTQFLNYVTNPTLPELLEVLFGVTAPNEFPREDLVSVFLTGVADLNQPADVVPSEQLRLNTTIAAVPAESQNPLGVLAGDTAGFPNGRRPGDNVVDAALRVVMGVLLPEEAAPDGQLPYTDGVANDASRFDETFPYLRNPLPGSPNDAGDDE